MNVIDGFLLGFMATVGYTLAQLAMVFVVLGLIVGAVFAHIVWRNFKIRRSSCTME